MRVNTELSCGRHNSYICRYWKLGSRVVSVPDSGAEKPGFKSQPRRCRVLGQTVHIHSPSSEIGSSPLKGCEGTADLAESNGSLPPGLWLTSPAKNRDQLRNPIRSVIEYGLFSGCYCRVWQMQEIFRKCCSMSTGGCLKTWWDLSRRVSRTDWENCRYSLCSLRIEARTLSPAASDNCPAIQFVKSKMQLIAYMTTNV